MAFFEKDIENPEDESPQGDPQELDEQGDSADCGNDAPGVESGEVDPE